MRGRYFFKFCGLLRIYELYQRTEKGSKQQLYSFLPNISWSLNLSNILRKYSVLERIWIKGSYLSQGLPQGERRPPKESKSQWIEIFHGGSHEKKIKFFQTDDFFFRKFSFSKEQQCPQKLKVTSCLVCNRSCHREA